MSIRKETSGFFFLGLVLDLLPDRVYFFLGLVLEQHAVCFSLGLVLEPHAVCFSLGRT